MNDTVGRLRADQEPERKTFINMSFGYHVDDRADAVTAQILSAPEGSKLHDRATELLGGPPTRVKLPDGRFRGEAKEFLKVKNELVIPEFSRTLADPALQEELQEEKAKLGESAMKAREEGIMIFHAAGNGQARMDEAGFGDLAGSVFNDVPGFFTVGAIDPKTPRQGDETMAEFSSGGGVEASARGVRMPVGVEDDGTAKDLYGTSFSTPAMVETAAAMSRNNPDLSLDEIESILTDSRVVQNLPGTTRDGAGALEGPEDKFAALVLGTLTPGERARVTRPQIDALAAELDRSPEAPYDLRAQLGLT